MLRQLKRLFERILSKLLCKFSPDHIAIILDGNRRYANLKGITATEGHKEGAIAFKNILPLLIDLQVKYVSLFVFSVENFSRKENVQETFTVIKDYLEKERAYLSELRCRIVVSGKLEMLPKNLRDLLMDLEEETRSNTVIVLNICCAYSSTTELEMAMNRYLCDYKSSKVNCKEEDNKDNIKEFVLNDKIYRSYQYQSELPFPEIMIRTSGETRLSDFLIYQTCHNARIYFVYALWPQISNITILLIILHYVLFYI